MTRQTLFESIKKKESFLCVGLDTDIRKIPSHLLKYDDPIFEFNRRIIDSTYPYTVAYKPNVAFYESQGSKGWDSLKKTEEYIPEDIFSIADAKRGDIGNTSKMYANAFFKEMDFDSITLAPYMGIDSITPFFDYPNKWIILLAATSNAGASEIQDIELTDCDGKEKLFERIIKVSAGWGSPENTMYVIGATRATVLKKVRKLVPNHFLLIPGIGAQGGSLGKVCKHGLNSQCGLLINSSRSIIYADDSKDFAKIAAQKAKKVQLEMARQLQMI